MNKYLTFPGLQPIYLGDIDFFQESVRDAFLLLLKGLTGQNNPRCVLIEATPQSDGAICFDGEILPLKYGVTTENSIYKIESIFGGRRVFKNQESYDCYETRYVVISEGQTGNPDSVKNFPVLQSLILKPTINQDSYEFQYEDENYRSTVKVTKIGEVYCLSGSFEQLRNFAGTVAYFRLPLPGYSNLFFTAAAKTAGGAVVSLPLTMTARYQTEGIAVAKYNQISISQKDILEDQDRYVEGNFSLIIQ